MKKRTLLICLWICTSRFLFGGDIAVFTNLGFSGDSGYFMFAQYGIEELKATPYADLFLVDVPANAFVADGMKEFRHPGKVAPGNSGEGALFTILEENLSLTRKYKIDHLAKGRILYHLIDGEKPKELIEFRDFNKNNTYQVSLIQTATGSGKDIRSSFYINLRLTFAGSTQVSRKIGHATYQRKGVRNYRIRQIILAPDEKSLIFIMEKEEPDTIGVNIRYMVETVKIN